MDISTSDVIATFGVIAAATTGGASWWNADKANRLEDRVQNERRSARKEKSNADLQRAERDGWQTLIDTTRTQYQQMVDQASVLQSQRDTALDTIRNMKNEADALQDQIDMLIDQAGKGEK